MTSEEETIHVVEIVKPHDVRLVQWSPPSSSVRRTSSVMVRTTYTAISAGTELLAFKGEMPVDIDMDTTISTFQQPFAYPCRYGYCAVGVVINSDNQRFNNGTNVFAFREHVSAFQASSSDIHAIPEDVPIPDAALVPMFETALSLIMDAAPLSGDIVCVVGQGLIGLVVAACIRKLYPYNRLLTIEPNEPRRRLSLSRAGAHVAVQSAEQLPLTSDGHLRADVTIEVSGQDAGLDEAIKSTRDYGRIVLGSWFGTKSLTLNSLGGRFHRSHISLVASQVSHIPAAIAPRWSKQRRFKLAWTLLTDISPVSAFDIPVYKPQLCADVYQSLSNGNIIGAIFDWSK